MERLLVPVSGLLLFPKTADAAHIPRPVNSLPIAQIAQINDSARP